MDSSVRLICWAGRIQDEKEKQMSLPEVKSPLLTSASTPTCHNRDATDLCQGFSTNDPALPAHHQAVLQGLGLMLGAFIRSPHGLSGDIGFLQLREIKLEIRHCMWRFWLGHA